MDSCCAILKANAHPVQLDREGVRNIGAGFWGESMRGSLKSSDLCKRFFKISKGESSRVTTLKSGRAYSVLTSDINKEAMVREFHAISVISDL